MAQVVIVKHDLPDTLIGMSVIGPARLQACFHKQHLKYYIDWGTPNAQKAFLKCQFPLDFDAAAPEAVTTLIAYTGAVIPTASMRSSSNLQKILSMPRSMTTLPAQSLQEVAALFDRSVRVLATPAEPMLSIAHPAYLHIRPLDVGMVDKRTPMTDTSTGMVVVQLFPGLMATTEALLRQGVRIQKVYACERDATSRLIDAKRLALLHTTYPEQLRKDAIRDCHSHLPPHAIQITWGHVATMVRPDLVVASFPGQGFLHTSEKASLGLRDARTLRDLEKAVRVIHLINSLWPRNPCAYLFETVDATNHPQEDVRGEFNNVVKRILGPGVSFEPLAVSSDAYRARRLWTNLAPTPLIAELIQEAGSYAFHTNDSSMVHPGTLSLWDDPYALGTERERQLMDNSTWIGPSVTEVDGHPLLKSTMDMHALTFTIGSAMCFQNVFFPAWDSTIVAAQHTLQPDSVSLQKVAKFCQEGKLARGTLKKVSPMKVDAHSTIPLQDPAPDEVLGQASPGLGGGLGQIDGRVNDDPSEKYDASLPDLINDNEEEGDGPSTDWDMGGHLTLDPKSKLQKLLTENRNVFTFTMDNMTTIQKETFKVTLTNHAPTLDVLGSATLGLGGGLDPVKDFQSVHDNDTVVFHPIKADENEAKPSFDSDSQAMEIALEQGQLEVFTKMAPPTTVSGLRAFLGTAGYYRRYVPNYHRTTVPLNALLQSGVVWTWTPEAQQAFEELQAKLTIKAQTCEVCHDKLVNCRTGMMPCVTITTQAGT
jgi:hypothetical protein